jgi:NAD(P)H-dependent FMN reductase
MSQPGTLKNLIDLVTQLENDQALPDGALRRRDRPIGKELSALTGQPLAQLAAWLERISAQHLQSPGSRVAAALRVGTLVLLVVGLLLGWLTAAAVFYYDGSHPVNIIHALAVFVGLQMLLLLVTSFTFLPDHVLRFLPGMRSLREAFSLLSPGRLPRLFSRILPSKYREATQSFLGRTSGHHALYGWVEKWLIVRAGQGFGVAFNLGALAGCLYLVVFSDLAFGWSTTLQTDAPQLKALTDGLSWPWAGLIPQAQPSLELIVATRYFRFQPGALPGIAASSPVILGEWWPFLFLCLLVYGLLPRILTLTFAASRLQRALTQTLLHLPGVPAIFDRLNSQWVETRAEDPEQALDTPLETELPSRIAGTFRGQPVVAIDWGVTGLNGESFSPWLQQAWGGILQGYFAAGGSRSLDQDRKVLRSVAASPPGPVLLLVKSWEPPMAEFKDFVRDLRRSLDPVRPIAVMPVGLGSSDGPLPADAELAAVWATVVKQLGDPWTFIAPLSAPGRPT